MNNPVNLQIYGHTFFYRRAFLGKYFIFDSAPLEIACFTEYSHNMGFITSVPFIKVGSPVSDTCITHSFFGSRT